MSYAIQWLRSLIFNLLMYITMPIVGLLYLPWAIASPKGAIAACHRYANVVQWLARVLIGLRVEIRGTPPTGEVMMAAKHQSFFDVMAIYSAVPYGKFIMKSLLKYAPVFGWFTMRMGAIAVDRGKRGAAIKKMVEDVQAGAAMPGQVMIYPQGTRVAPGEYKPYKKGTAALYQALGQPCIPIATNIGVFWPKRGVHRRAGTAVVEFLDPIPPGMDPDAFMVLVEEKIETASDALAAEAKAQL